MTTLFFTLTFAFVIILIAIGLLGIGWLLTGKARICRGSCGRNPHQKEEETGCHLCQKPEDNHDECLR